MDLNPWKLWTNDGRPGVHTEEIVSVLEDVLRRDPNHIGANHFYIHALEASPIPERALPSAARLGTLVPAAGHLVHMSAHIYERTGDYADAVRSNEAAVAADETFLAQTHTQASMYGTMYYSHNLHFLTFANMMEGRLAEARKSAQKLANNVMPADEKMPMLETFEVAPTQVLLRFARWQEILALPDPHARIPLTEILWHYARGVADARTGNVEAARTEREAMEKSHGDVAAGPAWGIAKRSDGSTIFDLAEASLDARIAAAGGDSDAAIAAWRKAVALEDGLNYDEPPNWYYPARESLGAALLAAGRSAEAEKVFREDIAAESAQSAVAVRAGSMPRSGKERCGCCVGSRAIRGGLAECRCRYRPQRFLMRFGGLPSFAGSVREIGACDIDVMRRGLNEAVGERLKI